MDYITVLYAPERLTKKFTGSDYRKSDFDQHLKWFEAITYPVSNIKELSDYLTLLEQEPNACVIRAKLKEGQDPKSVIRRIHDHNDGITPSFEEDPDGHHWVMFDFDKVPVTGLDSNEERLAHLLGMLPQAFHDASFHYQWSSSAGMDGWQTLSAHLWFWLSDKWRDSLLIERIEDQNWDIDECTIRTVQCNYTAAPIFEDCDDPVEVRSGFMPQLKDEVVLPSWVRPSVRVFKGNLRAMIPVKTNKTFEQRLEDIGPRYHMPIQKAVACYVKTTKDFDRQYLIQRITDAIHAGLPGTNPKRLYLSNSYLNASIDGAIRKFGA